MQVFIRYDTQRDFGGKQPETRREYNLRFGQDPGPEAEIPLIAGHIWEWFWRLAARRTESGMGIQPISFSEVKAWMELSDTEVRSHEIDMLLAIDDAYVGAERQERADQSARKDSRAPKSKTGRLF
jgi:hypothetical protein